VGRRFGRRRTHTVTRKARQEDQKLMATQRGRDPVTRLWHSSRRLDDVASCAHDVATWTMEAVGYG
jgi:hypothetical protein